MLHRYWHKESGKHQSTNSHAVEIIGQRIGYDIVDGKLYEQQATWGGQLFDNEKQCNVYCVGGKDKVTVSPIFEWTDKDIWDFIKGNNMPYCDLYDKGFHRIGCLFCPVASPKEKQRELSMFPRFAEKVYIRAIHDWWNKVSMTNLTTPNKYSIGGFPTKIQKNGCSIIINQSYFNCYIE